MVITFSLSLPRDDASVPVVRRLCRNALDDLGVHETCVSDIELAVTEACTNVLRHAEGTPNAYETTIAIDHHDCSINVIDSGNGFDASLLGHEEALVSAESGRGIHLIRALVDSVEFISLPNAGTMVHLEKRLVYDSDSILQRLADVAN